jgi:hypothetical protein
MGKIAALVAALAATIAAVPAPASVLVARDAKDVRLEVDRNGRALITYRQGGTVRHVLASGAVDEQVTMRLDYSGGRGAWKTFRDASGRYDGPQLPWFVTAVKARDGSYWALQSWQRKLPNFGAEPNDGLQRAWELHLSHWRGGEVPKLEVWTDWVWSGRFRHLFGRLTYKGTPVFGHSNTPAGVPTDPFGRNLYLDTFGSGYGAGWERENSFLTHKPRGTFCYGFYAHDGVLGDGSRYRISVLGPGATPVVVWEGADPGPYDREIDLQLYELQRQIVGDDPRCQKA